MQATVTIQDLIQEYKPCIEESLELSLENPSLKQVKKTKLHDAIKYSVLNGGKRLRAILALITAEAVLNSKDRLTIKENPASGLATALELIHAGSLIHDDLPCMDDDDLRRGKPSNHKAFGEATALLAGDFLLCYPLQVFNQMTPPSSNSIHQELTQAVIDMITGQEMDLELSEFENQQVSKIKEMESLKTGALIKASVVLAAKLVKASESQIKALQQYSENLGLAFQITDDILDCTSSCEELGKSIGKDEEQNKFTYVKEYGIDKARDIAKDLISEAKEIILNIGVFPDKLLVIADYVISRNN